MNRRQFLQAAAVGGVVGAAGCAAGGRRAQPTAATDPATETTETADATDHTPGAFDRQPVATGFAGPWAVEPLPDGRLLVTEKPGRLQLVDPAAGRVTAVPGAPSVFDRGQGGLLDAKLDPAYPEEPYLYLTYAARGDGELSSTHVGRGRLDPDEPRLRGFELLYAAEPFVASAGHYGSRIAFDGDRRLYVSVGDRQFKNFGPDHHGQRLDTELGAVLRLTADGDVPADNPFRDRPDARDTIFSYGHRNPQGLATRPATGRIWASEFGEQDGDEVNLLRRGGNYGWPVADEGCTYGGGEPIGVSHADRSDVIAPVVSWPCGSGGFPPSGTAFYDGDGFPEWRGDLFVAGLASRSLVRITVDGETDPTARVAGTLLSDENERIRDVAVAPDGSLLIARDGDPAPVVRLTPA